MTKYGLVDTGEYETYISTDDPNEDNHKRGNKNLCITDD